MSKNKHKASENIVSRHDYIYYIIEEYQSKYDRWVQVVDTFYLKEYEFGQNSSCGECWQTTGKYGMFDLDYAKKYLSALKKALNDGSIKELTNKRCEVTDFRLCKVHYKEKKTYIK